MSGPIRALRCGLAVILVTAGACGHPDETGGAASEGSATTSTNRAVAVARAIQATPARADSILAAHGLSRADFDALLYEIAADPSRARAYAETIK